MPSTTEPSVGEAAPDASAPTDLFDLIVVGAGINGAGIARDAAARGLRVALVEREDIGSGTSNYSGRLVHGGLRYLEQGDIKLVRESLRERERLFQLAPHLVKPVSLMMPFYRHNKRSQWSIRAAMMAYDVLSFDKSVSTHKVLSRQDTISRSPGINQDGLQGAAIFYDGQVVWSERLCVEVVLAAHADGCKVYTYAEVDGLISDGEAVRGIRFTDRITGKRHALGGRMVINAAGPWVDAVLASDKRITQRFIGGTKGSHLVVRPFPGAPKDVVYYESHKDGRLVLVIPWGEQILIGTTDQRFEGDPDTARADAGEVSYLLGEVNRLVPGANLRDADILYTYSGVRPLPFVPDKSEWNVSRSHVIKDHAPQHRGLLSIIGGKLTTYRSLAEETVDIAFKQLGLKPRRCLTTQLLFPGAHVQDWAGFEADLQRTSGLPETAVHRLVGVYGSRAGDVIALGRHEPALLEPLGQEVDTIGAELAFTYDTEFARTLTDVLLRRTMIGHRAGSGADVADRAADILAPRAGWDQARRDREVAEYRRYVERFAKPGEAPGDARHPRPADAA
ncbi:glycerol-3-phosphate dehydrogenase/oxidase [Lichenihabitans sp. Uapishka_5]|uniref:glycerol-3-phosphate dehydrogenase/oxidase n=1 Tax=Lichenihabitans sp. Uapishka_5 TaxID=3037302 RepID=UPI0029E81FDD|nr:glycerol-3-phosphate dehydrogenase/oxidase [Lichenihabitans sp. Uapishka_5]MDX7950294.1 glycerol-3-phosphate dehydrogenase/oxidase [Lichenihabitans sp. Uapishka_5]